MKWITLAGACLLLSSIAQGVPVSKSAEIKLVHGKHFDRVVVVVLPSGSYVDAVKDPYLSTLAEKQNGLLLTNYESLSPTSQPNYVGMISGSTSGAKTDANAAIDDRKSIVDLLEAKNITWGSYHEDYKPLEGGQCNPEKYIDQYVRYHNPFMAFSNIATNPARCKCIKAAAQFDVDIKNNAVPQFVYYTPNLTQKGEVGQSSAWLKSFLDSKLHAKQFGKNTLFVVTWDKPSTILRQQVMTLLLGPAVKRSSHTDGVPYDHYSVLKTVQENWDLPSLGQKDDKATPFILKDLAENGASEKIKNVVILMFENRSFDRMMGWFKYNDEIDGLEAGKNCNYVDPTDKKSLKICATNKGLLKDPLDPNHEYWATTAQVSGNASVPDTDVKKANMQGFVSNFASTYPDIKNNASALHQIMDGFDPKNIPITYELASNYTIIDRWFSSFAGSTMPNRMYLHSATSHGEVWTEGKKYIVGYPQKTIYNNLEEAGIEWNNYFYEIPSLVVFQQLRADLFKHRYRRWHSFIEDTRDGKLPPVTFLDPAYNSIGSCIVENDAHPPSDVADAEKLLKEVYERLRASPQWNQTLLVVTFDEHGGYYDHVDTPLDAPNPDGINYRDGKHDFNFDRSGVRVPAILISPWVEKGAVIHGAKGPFPTSQYEHSSVPATLKKLFNLPHFLTKRDEWAGTFEGAISLDKPRTEEDCPKILSDPPKPQTPVVPKDPLSEAFCDLVKGILQGL